MKNLLMRALLPIAGTILILGATGCGDKTNPDAGFDDAADTTSSTLTIVEGERSEAPESVSFAIETPEENEVVADDTLRLRMSINGFELKAPTKGEATKHLAYSMDGQHIHVIVDNKPYMAAYDTTFAIGGLKPGIHSIRAFPSRSWHESVKIDGAFQTRMFYMGTKSGDPPFDPSKPLLTYSRPKGEYAGDDAKRIMIDFYLSNCTLGPDSYKVIASVDGSYSDTITTWAPHFIEGLSKGEHTIHLRLIDADGNAVENGTFNDTERTISVVGEKRADADKGSEEDDGADLEKDLFDAGRHSQGL
jgi:hypothetical protein